MMEQTSAPRGLVSLVGAGPGDPELLTLRALKRLRGCEAVVHDRLLSPVLLDHCPPWATRHDVGKMPGHHDRGRQREINELLVQLGREGLRVVRLKGGDPFVFGRGGEEVLALSEAGVPFEVVPGVSSALAAPAAAGIPVTHRGLSGSVTVATGHACADGSEDDSHDWVALARMRGTLVFLMAVEHLERICTHLLTRGRPASDAAALIRWGTTHDQTVLSSTLGEIAGEARAAGIRPRAVLVIGPTVPLAEVLGRTNAPVGAWRGRG